MKKILFLFLPVILMVFFATVANAAPQLSNLQPSGSKIVGTSINLSLITNEKVVCKYATADEWYSNMTDVFNATTDGLSHTKSLGSLTIGDYMYYVGCQDVAGNEDYGTISFSVIAAPAPASPPASGIDACIRESSPGKNDRCPVRDKCCQIPHESGGVKYQNYLDYIVNYCGGQYSPSMCSAVPSASTNPSNPAVSSCVGDACILKNPLGETTTFDILLNKIIDFIFWVGMVLAPVMFIVAGFMYVISAGSPQKVEQARKIMIYTVIGLVVLLLARGLVTVLESIIGVK